MRQRAIADSVTKKESDVSFSCVCHVICNEFCKDIVKVVRESRVLAVKLYTILMKKRKDIRKGFQQFHLFYLQLNESKKTNFSIEFHIFTNPHVARLSKREMFRDQTSSNVFGDQKMLILK